MTDIIDNIARNDSQVVCYILREFKFIDSMLNFKETKSIHPQRGNEISNPPGTLDVTQRDEKKVCVDVLQGRSPVSASMQTRDQRLG